MATELQSDVRERVGGYIKHNASKSNEAVLDLIQHGHEQLMGLIEGLSDEQATFKPSAEEWSVLDTMQHVVAAKKGVAHMCEALARGEEPGGIGGEGEDTQQQDGVTGRTYDSLAEAVEAAVAAQDELVAFVSKVSDESNTELTYDHFLFGPLNCREWAVFQRVHDGDHGGQIEKVKAADGYPA